MHPGGDAVTPDAPDRPPESPASVFRALSRIGDVRSRVELEPAEPATLEPERQTAEGRYLVLGEIARGDGSITCLSLRSEP